MQRPTYSILPSGGKGNLRIRSTTTILSLIIGVLLNLGLHQMAWSQEVVPAPTGLTATTASSSSIDLSWTNNSVDETAIIIERSKIGVSGPFTKLIELIPGTQSYTNNGLLSLTPYWYRVYAVKDALQSDYSNVDDASTFALDPALTPFTIIALPDTQNYSDSNPQTFYAQTEYIVKNQIAKNILFTTHLGDCVQHANDTSEWDIADTAMSKLEDPNPFDGTNGTGKTDGIPYGISVGNHDQSSVGNADPQSTTSNYNLYFGESRFAGRAYYGGNDDSVNGHDNDNNYELFEGGGLKFVIVHLEYDGSPDQDVLDWAKNVINLQYPDRWAIVVTHYALSTGNPGDFSNQGQAIYDALKDSPNFFLFLGGHDCGEAQRTDVHNGHTVHTLLSNYQCRPNEGNGWLRILEFEPNADQIANPGFTIHVKTYSPTLDSFETDSNSQFDLAFDLSAPLPTPLAISPSTVTRSPSEQQVFTAFGGTVATPADYTFTLETNNSGATLVDHGNGTATYTTGGITGVADTIRLTDTLNDTVDATVNSVDPPVMWPVTVTFGGAGSGTVTSVPAGINCPGTCTADFLENAQVALTAGANPDSFFDGWNGAGCSGTGTCTIQITQAESVTANFSLIPPDLEDPVVNVTYPNVGDTVSGTVSLSASATDNVGVAGVQFLVNGLPVGTEVTNAPWTLSWDSSTVVPGTYVVSAQARDFAGNTAVAPEVAITVEVQTTLFSDNFDSGNLGIYGQIAGDWTTVSEPGRGFVLRQTSSALTLLYAAAENFSGSYQVKAEIWNEDNDTAGVAFRVNPAAPNNIYSCSATADGGSQAGFYQNVNSLGSSTMLDGAAWTYVRSRWYTVTITVDQNANTLHCQWESTEAGVEFEINMVDPDPSASGTIGIRLASEDNFKGDLLEVSPLGPPPPPDTEAPVTSMVTPTEGQTVSGLVPLQATATDNVGVVGVQFFINGSPLGTELPTAPWTVTWDATTAPPGTYLVSAQARDAAGNTATTPAVSVDVEAPPAPVLWPLSLTVTGTGSGTVTSAPAGISCPGTCSADFLNTTPVVLTAVANPDSSFDGWTGAGCSGTSTCTVTLTQAESVTASFSLLPPQSSLFSDNFDDGNLSEYGQISGNWHTASEPGRGLVLRHTSNAHTILYAAAENFSGSYQVQAEIWNEDNDAASVAFRVDPATPNHFYRCSATADNGSQAGFYLHTGSVSSSTFLAGQSWTYVRSRWYTVTITVDQNANTLHCQWASVEAGVEFEISMADPDPTATGSVGIRLASEDNFKGDLLEVTSLGPPPPPDTEAPVTSMVTPTDGQTVSGLVPLQATATDNVGVVGVQFFINGSPLGTELPTAPWTVTWDATTAPPGTYLVSAQARDAAGNTATTPAVSVVIDDTEAPSTSMVTPTEGQTVSGLVPLQATATDNVGVVGVQFFINGSPLGTELPTAPWTVTWDATTAPPGTYLVSAQARDAAGNTATTPAVSVVIDDTEAPSTSMVTPTDGQTVSGLVPLQATATDNVGVVGVQFFINGSPLGTELPTAPWTVTWDATTAPPGTYLVSAQARDAAGNTATTPAVSVVIDDTEAPSTSMVTPTDGQTVSGLVPLQATATDNVGVVGVQFFINGSPLGTELPTAPWTVTWDATTAPPGTYLVSAQARDAAGNTATTPAVSVVIDDTEAPSTSMVTPTDGQTVSGLVPLQATATDNVGVVGVQFFINGSPLGTELPTAPWTVTWDATTAPPGTYLVSAQARDAAGNTATTPAVSVVIDDTEAPSTSMVTPTEGQTVSGLVPLQATATDNVGVVGVQFFINGSPLGTELPTAPWTVTWDATTAPPGTYLVSAQARDAAGNTATTPAVSVDVEAPPAPVLWPLSLTVTGTGSGTVTSAPAGISCPGTCSADFLNTTPVVLTAVANPDSSFDGWTGAGCSGTSTCTVTLTQAESVTASFSLLPPQSSLFSDNFDDGNLSEYGQISGNWHTASEPGRGLVLRQTTNAHTILYAAAENFSGSYQVQAEIWNEDNDAASVAFRVDPATPNHFYRCSATADNGSQAGFYLHTGSVSSSTFLAGQSWTYVRSRWYTVTITVDQNANTLHCQWASVEAGVEFEISMADPDPTATGSVGIRLASEDNFKGDLLEVTSLGPPPPPDFEAPVVSLVAPTEGSTVSGSVTLNATATDNVGVVGVQFLINGSPLGAEVTSAPWTHSWNTASVLPGTYTLSVQARDAANNTTVTPGVTVIVEAAPGFVQDGGPDGLLVVEAEHFHANVSPGLHNWIVTTPAGYSGDSAMVADPNTGTNQKSNYALSSPRLDFEVNFTQTGTHYVWIRGIGASNGDDSVHIGLDGQELATSDELSGISTSWTWSNLTMDGPVATIEVPSIGSHTLNLWMREDGTVIDKIVVTVNPNYIPSALGPPESPLQ